MSAAPGKPAPPAPAFPKRRRGDFPQEPRDTIGDHTADNGTATYILRLYVAGNTPKSALAVTNLKKICEEHLAGRYKLQIMDLLENPKLARKDQILAIPTLVRQLPMPVRKILGDLSNTERVLIGLDLPPGK